MQKNHDTVTLAVGGVEYAGWKSVRVAAGLERLARDFELSVSDRWPGSDVPARRVRPGDFVQVRVGADLLVSGYVDATPVEYDARGYTFLIRGRSRTADLVDSSPDGAAQQWANSKAEAIAADLAAPYGVEIAAEVDTGAPLIEHQVQQGESVFDSLDRIARARQVLVTDDERGRLVFAKPGGGGRASSALVLGENILAASAGLDYSEVYSDYIAKGQRSGDDEEFGEAVAQGVGRASDASLKRKRVYVVRQPGQADARTLEARASYEAQVRRAKAGEVRYKVAGWRQADGALWRPNLTVYIKDGWMDLDGDLLISEVIYSLDEGGMVAELVCIDPGAFATEPLAEKDGSEGGLPPGVQWMDLTGGSAAAGGSGAAAGGGGITWGAFDK